MKTRVRVSVYFQRIFSVGESVLHSGLEYRFVLAPERTTVLCVCVLYVYYICSARCADARS